MLRPEEVAILAWSFASSGHHDSLLMDGLAYAAEANVTRMASSELATTVWAFGKSGLSGGQAADSFFAALSEELPRRHRRPKENRDCRKLLVPRGQLESCLSRKIRP